MLSLLNPFKYLSTLSTLPSSETTVVTIANQLLQLSWLYLSSGNPFKLIIGFLITCVSGMPIGLVSLFTEDLTKNQTIAICIVMFISFVFYAMFFHWLKIRKDMSRERAINKLRKELNDNKEGIKYE